MRLRYRLFWNQPNCEKWRASSLCSKRRVVECDEPTRRHGTGAHTCTAARPRTGGSTGASKPSDVALGLSCLGSATDVKSLPSDSCERRRPHVPTTPRMRVDCVGTTFCCVAALPRERPQQQQHEEVVRGVPPSSSAASLKRRCLPICANASRRNATDAASRSMVSGSVSFRTGWRSVPRCRLGEAHGHVRVTMR